MKVLDRLYESAELYNNSLKGIKGFSWRVHNKLISNITKEEAKWLVEYIENEVLLTESYKKWEVNGTLQQLLVGLKPEILLSPIEGRDWENGKYKDKVEIRRGEGGEVEIREKGKEYKIMEWIFEMKKEMIKIRSIALVK